MLKHLFTIIYLVFVISIDAKIIAQTPDSQPNIVLIITDDQGYGDFGFTGNPDIKTPVLDQLSKESVNFDQFYVSPVCAPTRASLLTGRSYSKTGVYDTYNGGAMMATEEITIAEALKKEGYKTGIFGKWHLGDSYPMRPQDQGFDESLVHLSGGIGQPGDYLNYFKFDSSYFDPVLMHNGNPIQTKGYCSDVYTDYLINFIEGESQQPFFAYLAFNAPHTPLQVPKRYYEVYSDLEVSQQKSIGQTGNLSEMNEEDLETTKRVYGMISNIDENVGRVLQTLAKNGLEKNTLVIFLGDNGPRGIRYNGGLRNRKSSVYEGGIKTPLLIRFPDEFDSDTHVDVVSAHIDILPTLADLLNIDLAHEVDGRSLFPLIKGRDVKRFSERSLFFYWDRGLPELYRNIAVRNGDYKLVGDTDHLASIDEFELFNIKRDPSESSNLINKEQGQAQRLKDKFDEFYNQLVSSKHLRNPPRIIIGASNENPTILNRNDAKGAPGMWNQDHIFAYWTVKVEEDAMYNISANFINELPAPGKYVFKMGPVQKTVDVEERGNRSLKIKNVPLKKGEWRVESWYLNKKMDYITPFTVILQKI